MSEQLYREVRGINDPLFLEGRDVHVVPVDDERLTRGEWEATIDLKRMAMSLFHSQGYVGTPNPELFEDVQKAFDAAVGQLSNRHQLVVDTNVGEDNDG